MEKAAMERNCRTRYDGADMILAPLFAQAAGMTGSGSAVSADEKMEAALWRLYHEGAASWPQIPITAEKYAQLLGRQLSGGAALQDLSTLRARDLYLVCALGLGDRTAQAILESEYMPRVRHALLQFGTSEPGIADIKQNLYGRLLEKRDATVVRLGYGGRGDLGSWLCTCAIREAGQKHKKRQRELALEHASEEILRDLHSSPEVATLTGRLKEVFQESFKEAIATLSSRERNLLRYHFLAELSIDQIGAIYHIHRATAARWVAKAQERLVKKTRELFVLRAQVNAESLPRIMELIESQLSVNLGNVLKRSTENDPNAGGPEAAKSADDRSGAGGKKGP